jgi:hypothetical protein
LKRRRGDITKFEPAAVNRDKPTNLVFLKLSITNNKAPTAPVLVSPSDNATNQPLEVNLLGPPDPEKTALNMKLF